MYLVGNWNFRWSNIINSILADGWINNACLDYANVADQTKKWVWYIK